VPPDETGSRQREVARDRQPLTANRYRPIGYRPIGYRPIGYRPIGYRLSAIGYRLSAIGYRRQCTAFRIAIK
jgi:hypothetical protein